MKNSTIDTLNYFDQSKKIVLSKDKELLVNSLNLILSPDSGYFALEVQRKTDKGVSANHDKLAVRKFDNINLDISDIVLASDIKAENEIIYPLKRHKINILPNPPGIFTEKNKLFIYYEVYNLQMDKTGLAKFEQKITITKVEERSGLSKFFGSILSVFGDNNDNNSITLSTNYQSYTKNPQIYFQLDMNKYEEGNYILTIKIKDNISGKETEQNTKLTWR